MFVEDEDEAWGEILRLWTETSEAPKAIGDRYGISHQLVVGRARSQRWPDRPGQNAEFGENDNTETDAPDGLRVTDRGPVADNAVSSVGEGQLLKRLYDAIERIVKKIEDRMAQHQEESIADTERLVRTLGSLIRNIGKIQDVDEQFQRRSGTAKSKQKTARDAELRREELAARVCSILGDGSETPGTSADNK